MASVQIRVNPQDMLPERITVARGRGKFVSTIDYPAEGPADIYALGVPRDAAIEDRTPPADLDRILSVIERNRRDFGDYLAVAGDNENHVMSLRIVRCKGDRLRFDGCLTECYMPRPSSVKMDHLGKRVPITSPDVIQNWWQQYAGQYQAAGALQKIALYDGREIYLTDPSAPNGWKPDRRLLRKGKYDVAEGIGGMRAILVELLAYPQTLSTGNLSSASFVTARLDPKGEGGPAGSIRIERLIGNAARS